MHGSRRLRAAALALVLVVSAAFESIFLRHGINPTDEGWALYAAMSVQRGAELYREALWVFPPGHLLAAYLGYAWDPPGIVAARLVYAGFAVAAVGAVFLLGARLMPVAWATLAALVTAIAAPNSHLMHVIFGYRYLVFSIGALLLFDRYLRTDRLGWMVGAGALIGVGVSFRLGPPFAATCGIGVACLATLPWRGWTRAALAAGAGLLATATPVYLPFALELGPETLWREIVVRPATMLALQSLPWPEIVPPASWSDRVDVREWFVALQFRLIWLLYALYVVGLAARWLRARSRSERFQEPLLLATVVLGLVFFSRSITRSDEPHLDSVIPPVCLLFIHAVSVAWRWGVPRLESSRGVAYGLQALVMATLLGGWIYLLGIDTFLPEERRGRHPVHSTDRAIRVHREHQAALMDRVVVALRVQPLERQVLDMTASPLLYVLADRMGPGRFDIVMPGTFLEAHEEERFLARLQADPPATIVWPRRPFDKREDRPVRSYAPRITDWIDERYRRRGRIRRWYLLDPVGED